MKSMIGRTETKEWLKIPGEKSRVGVYILQDGKFCYINPSFPIVTGYSVDELIGRDSLEPVVPEDRKKVRENAIKMLKGKLISPYYFRVICKDGSTKWLMATARSIQFQGRRATLGNYMEITVRKQAEEALKESEERYRELANSITDVFFAMDDHLRYTYWNKASEILTGIRAEDALGKSLSEIFPDTPGIRRAEKVYRDVLRTQQSQIFVTDYADRDGRNYTFEISTYPSRGGVAVFARDITERKQAEEALQKSEEKYRLLSENASDIIWTTDMNLKFTYASPSVEKLLGYTPEEFTSFAIDKILTPPSLELAMRVFQEELAVEQLEQKDLERTRTIELELVCKDGSTIWIEVKMSFLRDEAGHPTGISGIARDISERKKAEQALMQSEERYRTILEEMGDGYFETDLAGNFTFVNDAQARMLGCSREELIGVTYRAFTPEEDVKAVFEAYHRMYKTGEPLGDFPDKVIRKDGGLGFAETSAFPIRNDKGKIIGFRGIRRDITARKHAEEELQKSEERYRQLAENAGEAILVVQNDVIRFSNPKATELSGYLTEELTSRPFVEFIHPEDIDMVADRYLRRLKGETLPQVYDFRIIRKDGAIRWAELNAVLISWENRPAVLCFMSDITDRKKAEEELRIKDTALASSVNAIAMADMEGNLTYVNNAFLNCWGYKDKKQVLGKPSIGFWQVVDAAEEVQKAVLKEGGWTGELSAKRKDGTSFDVQLSSSLVKNKMGEPICMMASFVDITERKRTEEALRQSQENYRALFDSAVIGTIVLDAETMKVLIANQAAAKIFGFSSVEEALEVDPLDFILPEDKERVYELAEKALFEQNKQLTYDLRILTKDGKKIWISATGAKIVHQGRLAGLISFTDITEQKQQNERFMLADRLASIGELAAGAAHELNNPLTSVIGFSQLLMEKDISDDIRQDLTFINSEAQRAASITKNLL
ncbi:MAG: PAS domain S-box protein, partial [Deltaproteobacteria bacterium]